MGNGILDRVLAKLREAGFRTGYGFPGQARAMADRAVAAVHLEKVDNTASVVTVEVSIISPAVLGGTYCETEALRALAALQADGAKCIQSGCRFEGMAETYTVQILAEYPGTMEDDVFVPRPEFRVYLNGNKLSFVESFEAEEIRDEQAQYVMGQTEPVGICHGVWVWNLRLEEMIPAGEPEDPEAGDPLTIRLAGNVLTEEYNGCCWTSVQRIMTREGLRKIRKGFALERKVESDG